MMTAYKEYSEAKYFADQAGVYEISKSKIPSLGMVMKQVSESKFVIRIAIERL
jgi:hypothetical protein